MQVNFTNVAAVLVTLAALFSYLNHRFLRLPTTIALMSMALVFSLLLIALGAFVPEVVEQARTLVKAIDFDEVLMHGMLGFLLFAGALHVHFEDLWEQKFVIAILATVGILGSTFLVGTLIWWILPVVGLGMPFIYCLVFGALISPTDPISVLGIMRKVGAPKGLEVKIAGESLFNDGVGVVIFLAVLEVATGQQAFSVGHAARLLIVEAGGGALFGLAIGLAAYYLLKTVENYQVEILITLAVVAGGYPLALGLHISAPIAMVVAGLLIGNHGRRFAMSDIVRAHLDNFWELIDEVLNAVLFVLIGLEVLVLSFSGDYLAAGLLAIGVVLFSRFVSVAISFTALRPFREFTPHSISIHTWGGLRGGISVALALSLPRALGAETDANVREVVLTMTYIVVAFSVIVQGLTVGPLIKRLLGAREKPVSRTRT